MSDNTRSTGRWAIGIVAFALLVPAFAGCVTPGDDEGSAAIFVKDAPTDEFEHVNITFSKVAIHQGSEEEEDGEGNASDDGQGPDTEGSGWITAFEGEKTIDLLAFNESDSRAFLGDANLSEGTYNQIVITVDEAIGVRNDGSQVEIRVITGWIRVVRAWEVTAGETTAITVDLDMDRSLVEQGPRGWALKPVVGQVLVEEDYDGAAADHPDQGQAMARDGDGDGADRPGDQDQPAEDRRQGKATMTTYIKDAPTDAFDEIWLAFDTVRVHWAGNDTENGTWLTVFDGSRSVDLLNFSEEGAKAFLGEADVPTGRYTQIRVNVTDAWGIQDGNRTNITVSSGTAKVNHPFEIPENGTIAQVTIDLDLDRSLREQGNGVWRMTPVIGAVLVDHVEQDPRADQADGASENGGDQTTGSQARGNQSSGGQGNHTAGNETGGNQTAGAQGQGNQTSGGQGQGNQTAGGQGQGNQPQGDVSANVKDAPTDEFDEIWLTFDAVEVHWAGNETVNGSWMTVFDGTRSVNLLNFSEEGAKAFLGNATVPTGKYTQIRLDITEAWGIQDGNRTNITVSSSSAKVNRPFDVTENGTTELVIDVDLDRSLREQGNGVWRMAPVIGSVLVDHVDQASHADEPDQG